jgi:hypothetical protein
MKRHRRILLSLGFIALMGLMGGQAQAGTLTVVLSWGAAAGEQLTITGPPRATFNGGPPVDSLTFNLGPGGVNSYLSANGSNLRFAAGSGVSDNQPFATTVGFLSSVGQLSNVGGSGSNTMTITTFDTDYTAPMPQSELKSTSNGTFSHATKGDDLVFTSWYNSNNAAPTTAPGSGIVGSGAITTTVTATDMGANPISVVPSDVVAAPLGFSATYSLTNVTTINIAHIDGTAGYTGQTTVTGVIPEPASIVMMLTGIPVPLIVLGILHRKARAAGKS